MFQSITDKESLQALLAESMERPVVVFKHSNACPISSRAYRELENFEGDVNLLVIQAARDVSNELVAITGVEHESPQVIVLKGGKAVWDASHFDVKAAEVARVLEANA